MRDLTVFESRTRGKICSCRKTIIAQMFYLSMGILSGRDQLTKFLNDRSRTVAHLEALPLKDLWRTGRHSEFGQMTILRQVAYLAYHEQTHLPEIDELLQRFS